MRIGMIHQPHFLPWPGYVARCLAADVVVFLDNVKFNKNHFQQRTKFITPAKAEQWLTLPISHSTRSSPISEVEIAPSFRLMPWQRAFRNAYQSSPDFQPLWSAVTEIIERRLPKLSDVTTETLAYLLRATSGGNRVPSLVSGSLISSATERTLRLVEICRDQEITHLIMGRDAVRCHDCDLLTASGVTIVSHMFRGPDSRAPHPGVTVLHDMLLFGPAEVAERLRSDWVIEPITYRNI
jgi:hypothetical protein